MSKENVLIENMKSDKKHLENILVHIETDLISTNNIESDRFRFICKLLQMAQVWPFNADLVKAALELNSYNDRVALALLKFVVKDMKKTIKAAKRGR